MKKSIFALFFVFLALVSFMQARFFIGIDGGYSIDSVDISIEEPGGGKVHLKDVYKGNGYMFGFNLGTQHFFDANDSIGFRWLLSGGYGRTDLVAQAVKQVRFPSTILNLALGVDGVFDLLKIGSHSFGVFGGLEGALLAAISDAYTIDEHNQKNQVLLIGTPSLLARIGASFFFNQQHRVELLLRLPIYSFETSIADELTSSGKQLEFYKHIQIMLGYKFLF